MKSRFVAKHRRRIASGVALLGLGAMSHCPELYKIVQFLEFGTFTISG